MTELTGTSQIKYMTNFKQVSELPKFSGAIQLLKVNCLECFAAPVSIDKASTMDLSLSSNCL